MADDELVIKLKVENADAKKKLKEVKEEAKETGQEVESQARSISSNTIFTISALSTAFLVAGKAINFLKGGFESATDKAISFNKASSNIGLGAEVLQKWQKALERTNVGFEAFTSSFSEMQNLIAGKAWGSLSGEKVTAFSLLGIKPDQYDDTMELLEVTLDKLSAISNIKERNRLAGILGISTDLIYSWQEGAKSWREIEVLQEKTLKNLDAINRKKIVAEQEEKRLQEIAGSKLSTFVDTWASLYHSGKISLLSWITGEDVAPEIGMSDSEKQHFYDDIMGNAPDSSSSKSSVKNNIINILRNEGFSDAGINAVLANIKAESSFNPNAFNPKGGGQGAYGLIQWRGDRQRELKSMNGYDTVEVQMGLVFDEMKRRGVYDSIKNATDAIAATALFEKKIEVSGGQNAIGRFKNIPGVTEEQAQRALAQYYPELINSGNTYNDINVEVHSTDEAIKVITPFATSKGGVQASLER